MDEAATVAAAVAAAADAAESAPAGTERGQDAATGGAADATQPQAEDGDGAATAAGDEGQQEQEQDPATATAAGAGAGPAPPPDGEQGGAASGAGGETDAKMAARLAAEYGHGLHGAFGGMGGMGGQSARTVIRGLYACLQRERIRSEALAQALEDEREVRAAHTGALLHQCGVALQGLKNSVPQLGNVIGPLGEIAMKNAAVAK